jgi:RNA polymerase sigma factor (sigma-70 family)
VNVILWGRIRWVIRNMDYSKFVFAVQEEDQATINELVPVITGVLIKFLKVRQGAEHHDAEDVAQNTIINVTEKIRSDQLNNPDSVIYYLFTTAKNEYFKYLKRVKEGTYEEIPESYSSEGDQLKNILNAEKQRILEKCLQLLKPNMRDYITYWFNHPRDEAAVVADHFGITVNNAWTKKHRILKVLKDCVEKKLAA